MKIKLLATFLSAALLLSACTKTFTSPSSTPTSSTAPISSTITSKDEDIKETRIFIDSVGREVEIPVNVTKVAPSGPVAQLVLYTHCPDNMIGNARKLTDLEHKMLLPVYSNLPVMGQFYGKNANLNMEELIKAAPDVIIDIGDVKKTIVDDMNNLQKQLGIPVIFIEANMSNLSHTYEKLSELLGDKTLAKEKGDYCSKLYTTATERSATLKEEDKKSVYIAMGESGLNTNAKGSFHATLLETVGAINCADVEMAGGGGGSAVSFEQLLNWNPDVILADDNAIYTLITTDPTWKTLSAVQNNQVYLIPTEPYQFLHNPPSINRVPGIIWLGQILYPHLYPEDLLKETEYFYKNFYHIDVNPAEIFN